MQVVAVCAKNQVPKVVKRQQATHLISILDPATRVVPPNRIVTGGHLSVTFYDTHDPAHIYAVQPEHVALIGEWARALPADARLVVHCVAGVSRSTAVALALASRELGPESAADWLSTNRAEATPNRRLVALFDTIDGWGGQLIAAADRFPRPVWDED